MKQRTWLSLVISSFFIFSNIFAEKLESKELGPYDKGTFTFEFGDSKFDFAFRLTMPEWFAGKNIVLLNNQNHEDRVFFIRHTIDTSFHYGYGKNCYGHEIIQLHMNMRDRGVWGNAESIAQTTQNTIKSYEVRFGQHGHALPRHIWWIRELWVDLDLNEVFKFDFAQDHFATIGAFSFKLGRGIAFGDAFSVTPDPILGFSLEGSVDQYAFGGRFYGDIVKGCLSYDLYGALLNNQADSFKNTAAKIRGQEYGHKFNQFRDFAVVNYVLAGKLRFKPLDEERKGIATEAYFLFNDDPEQRIEFLGDAESKLGTLGAAGEFNLGNFEFGFDTAFNFGRQQVKGVDRNITIQENSKGYVAVANSAVDLVLNPGAANETKQKLPYQLNVIDQNGKSIDVQDVVNTSFESATQNGEVLLSNVTVDNLLVTGQTDPVPAQLVNGAARFRDPYRNKYRGYMFVADACYWLYKKDLKAGVMFGLATGDANPNKDLQFPGDSVVDGTYDGFIGIQEFYAGTRVRSAFFLSGAGRIPRLLDQPSQKVNSRFASTINRFTNIIVWGSSLWYRPKESENSLDVNPNVLMYWQDFAPRRFDIEDPRKKGMKASSYLGLEANVFFNAIPAEDLRLFNKIGIFFPGGTYSDLKGRPINAAQARFIDRKDRTGVIADREPLLGDDISFATNFGFEYIF